MTGWRYQVMDGVLSAYRAVYGAQPPIVNLPMSGGGVVLHNQQLWATRCARAPGHRLGPGPHGHDLRPGGHDGPGHGAPAGTTPGSGGQAFGSRYAGELSQYTVLGSHPLTLTLGSAPFGG